jgi:acyl carrier protein
MTGDEERGAVRRAWASVLGTGTEVHDDDNFFLTGGTSMAAIRLSRLLTTQLGREVPVRLVFDAATVAELCDAVVASAPEAR